MRSEKDSLAVQAVLLSFLLTLGAMGSMITGLGLHAEHFTRLVLIWAAVCVAAALLCRLRLGGWLLAGVFALVLLELGSREEFSEQALDMVCKISVYYNNAYGWGFFRSPGMGRGPMDLPLGLLGSWIAIAACGGLCGKWATTMPLLISALPLIACVVVIDTVPHSLYLYLWLLGFLLILLCRSARRIRLSAGVPIVRLALIPTALALALFFLAVPREGYDKQPEALTRRLEEWVQTLPDKWDQFGDDVISAVDGTVQPRTVRLDTLGKRIERVYPVMEVTAPVSGTVYLRGQHYDTYTSTGWTISESNAELFPIPEDSRELGILTITTRNVRDVVYLPYYPAENRNLLAGRIENTQRVKQASYVMRGLDAGWRTRVAVMDSSNVPLFQRRNALPENLELPASTHAWALDTVHTILNQETTATAAADAIAAYVRNSARYDPDTGRMDGTCTDFVRWFLEESDTGYCVHFATAATVLLRAAGIEARYVEGYMFTAQADTEVTVTADQSHAWAEYYEPLLDAWIVLEATPADLNGQQQTSPRETEVPDATRPQVSLPEETEDIGQPPAESTPDTPDTGTGEKPEKQPPDLGWVRWLLIPGLAFLVAEGQQRLRLRRRERKRRQGSANSRALALWGELEVLHRLLKTAAPEEARSIALKAKYSSHAISRQELAALEAHRTAALGALRQQPLYLRLLLRYVFALN